MARWLKESKCPRCGVSGTTKCNKDNGYCVKCDDQTSYDYCTPAKTRVELEARVRVLANDTLQIVDQLRQREQGPDFIVYVGTNEMNAIRYIGQPYYARLHDESFCGCRLIGVKLDDYFHVAAK